jgi:hypothetical protein
MPHVILFIKGSNLSVTPCGGDKLKIKGKIRKLEFVTIENSFSTYETPEPLNYTLTLYGKGLYLEYANHEFAVILGDIQWFEYESEKGTIYRRYEVRDPVILLYNLEDSD